jgi:hypothetical protein
MYVYYACQRLITCTHTYVRYVLYTTQLIELQSCMCKCVQVSFYGGRSAMSTCAGALAFEKRGLSLIGHLMDLTLPAILWGRLASRTRGGLLD